MAWLRHTIWSGILFLAGCGLAPAGPPASNPAADALREAVEGTQPLDGVTIRYGIGSEGWQGRTALTVLGSGPVDVTFDHRGEHSAWQSSLSEDEFLALCRLLVEHNVWEIEGQRDIGIPDEAWVHVRVEVEGFEPLAVGMWHGEALEHSGFGPIMAALAGLASQISGGTAK